MEVRSFRDLVMGRMQYLAGSEEDASLETNNIIPGRADGDL